MNTLVKRQRDLLLSLIALYMVAAAVYAYMPGGAMEMAARFGQAMPAIAPWQLALGNGIFILVVYVPAGLAGLWLARKASLPGIYRPDATPRDWFLRPLWIGLGAGITLVLLDRLAQRLGGFTGFPHPPFPASLLASFTAGVGEEILFRLFMMSLWVVILGWLLRRFLPEGRARTWSLWIANFIAALAFAAAHLGTAQLIAGVATPADLPAMMLAELIVLNGLIGVLAGLAFTRDGLIAAAGVHFWADIVWHGLYGLLA